MERAIVTPTNEPPEPRRLDTSLRWSARLSLTTRILAVNIFAVALLAGGLFYLDSYRTRLTEERLTQSRLHALIIRDAIANQPPAARALLLPRFGAHLQSRVRIYSADGSKQIDSFALGPPSYILRDPAKEPIDMVLARWLDAVIDTIVGSAAMERFVEPAKDDASAWPIIASARAANQPVSRAMLAPDRTPMVSAALTLRDRSTVLLTSNARDITRIVRAERSSVGLVMLVAALLSILLSLFLARTIVRPIRRLARAAVRVRLGRSPDIAIPTMPERRDEIGQLARSLSAMSKALTARIDATEAFAADVSHEIKNPLASLRSALEGLDRISDPELRGQLLAIANDDVRRIDRLVTDISDASRVDAELSRTRFEPVDVGAMLDELLAAREARRLREAEPDSQPKIVYGRPMENVAVTMGDPSRLVSVFENVIDNALSFSPPKGVIDILAMEDDDDVIVRISDSGPGVRPEDREKIFQRFHSDRPQNEAFGTHSGLGLAIAKSIVEAHGGDIDVIDRPDGRKGSCFRICLPRIATVEDL
ncbi:MAG: ATP-binding protein [Parasphingorhabdus sp.]|nr:ATP-binding protein [Parasphingorhabdus sp.]